MPWRSGILLALLSWLLLASPAAAADIKRYTTGRGVICINNTGPAKPGGNYQAAPVDTLGQKEPSSIAAAPAPLQEAGSAAIIELAAALVQEISQFQTASVPEPVRTARNISLPAQSETAPRLPDLQKVAYEVPRGREIPPQAAAEPGKTAGYVMEGGICRFRDRHAVLRISNAPAAQEQTAIAALPAIPGEAGARESAPAPARPRATGILPVSWPPPGQGLLPGPQAAAAAQIAALGPQKAIRHYRDSRGILHIENVSPGSPVRQNPSVRQARAEALVQTAALELPRPRAPDAFQPLAAAVDLRPCLALTVDIAPKLAVKPAAWAGAEGLPPPEPLQLAALPPAEIITPGGIHRYRDARGVWRIESLAPAALQLARAPGQVQAPAAVQKEGLLLAGLQTAPGREAPFLQGAPVTASPNGGTVIARLNRRGVMTITNLPPDLKCGPGLDTREAMARLEPIIREAALAFNLPPGLVRAVIRAESNFVPWAVSPKGAMGLMQLMPGTAADLGVLEPFNPRDNVYGGCRYLRQLLNSLGGSLPLALAAYNAGYQRVVNCGYQVPNIKETRAFLSQVIGWYLQEEKTAPPPWT